MKIGLENVLWLREWQECLIYFESDVSIFVKSYYSECNQGQKWMVESYIENNHLGESMLRRVPYFFIYLCLKSLTFDVWKVANLFWSSQYLCNFPQFDKDSFKFLMRTKLCQLLENFKPDLKRNLNLDSISLSVFLSLNFSFLKLLFCCLQTLT
jgi:hypothetical protein